MLTAFFSNFLRSLLFVILGFIIITVVLIRVSKFFPSYDYNASINPKPSLPTPQISGWIPWWKEKPGYDLVKKYPTKIKNVSPVWFMVDKDLKLTEVGEIDKITTVAELKTLNIRILPSLGSEISKDELSILLNDKNKSTELVKDLAEKTVALGVDGVDIDLEGIKKEDKEKFNSFLSLMSTRLKEDGLEMSVSIHAQTGKIVWDGVEGQDLETIGKIADEVRIMTYDEHSSSSKPGSVSSFTWIKNVAFYNLEKINKDKIVIGIPSYGYIWTDDGNANGLQFNEFNDYLAQKKYNTKRDSGSKELVINGENFSGWLSDSEAMTAKINFLRKLGFNKFIIWHLGGMDENFFSVNWSN